MTFKSLAGLLLGVTFTFTVAAAPLCALPPKPKACCGATCPKPQPKRAAACCHFTQAQLPAFAAAAPAPHLVVVADLSSAPVPSIAVKTFVLSAGSDRSPPQPDQLTRSGLSPPSLA